MRTELARWLQEWEHQESNYGGRTGQALRFCLLWEVKEKEELKTTARLEPGG